VAESSAYVKVSEVAAHFSVTDAAIYKWVDQGRIRSRRLGRRIIIAREEFEYIKANGLREAAEAAEEGDQKNLKPAWT